MYVKNISTKLWKYKNDSLEIENENLIRLGHLLKQSLQLWRFPVVWSDNWFSFHFWSRTWVSRFHRKAGLARTQGGFFCGPHAASDAHGQWKPVTQHAAPTAPEASALIRSPRRIFNWKMVSAQRAWYLKKKPWLETWRKGGKSILQVIRQRD